MRLKCWVIPMPAVEPAQHPRFDAATLGSIPLTDEIRRLLQRIAADAVPSAGMTRRELEDATPPWFPNLYGIGRTPEGLRDLAQRLSITPERYEALYSTDAGRIPGTNERNASMATGNAAAPRPDHDTFADTASTVQQYALMDYAELHEHLSHMEVSDATRLITKAEDHAEELSRRSAEASLLSQRIRDELREASNVGQVALAADPVPPGMQHVA